MLKFLRKYQKWMLVVFCGALMIAFLIPQAASQFSPQPGKRTMARTYDGEKITREMLIKTSGDVQMLRRLGLDPIPGLTLIPNSGKDLNDAMQWTLIQRAAEHNNLGASKNEAFNLIAAILDVQDPEALDAEAQKRFKVSGRYLTDVLARQYLLAEQYRQLVSGTEYVAPIGTNNQLASPGLQRLFASADANRALQPQLANIQQQAAMFGMSPQQLLGLVLQNFLTSDAAVNIVGHERVSAEQVQYLLQWQLTQLDLSVVVLDAEDRLAAVTVDDEAVRALFERYADDAPGTGQPYLLGYRVPNRVKLEALRFPIDAVRAAVYKDVTRSEIRQYFDDNRGSFIDLSALESGDVPKPANAPTAVQSEEIRLMLAQERADEKVFELAQQARLRLNEQTRGFKEDGGFKVLPDDFVPMPLAQLAAELEQEHGVAAEVIQIDDWVSRDDIDKPDAFTQAFVNRLPGSTVNAGGFPRPIPSAVLGGKAGLFNSFAPELSGGGELSFAVYAGFAKPFVDEDHAQIREALQVGLPARVMLDTTGSSYIFRLTDADPAHPATDLASIADQVRKDAAKVAAYEQLVEEKDTLVDRAVAQTIEKLMEDAESKKTLTGVTRAQLMQGQPQPIEGVNSTAPILEQAFAIADELAATTGVENAAEADRIFAVELPGDYKIAIVRVDTMRPLTRTAFKRAASSPRILAASAIQGRPADAPKPMSLESLMKATGFEWAEDYDDSTLDDDEDEDEEADEGDDDE